MEETEKVDTRLLPRLTKYNWTTEYKNAAKCLALNYGEAGEIILEGKDLKVAKPDRSNLVSYPDNDRGDRKFDKDMERFNKVKENKKKLMSKLISTMDKEVYDEVSNDQEYDKIMQEFDLLKLWNLMEQVCVGRGAVSVYSVVTRLLKLKQTKDEFVAYNKTFNELIADLNQQGTADKILKKITNALYIIGLDQDQFKDLLTPIYGKQDWPEREVLAKDLAIYAESTTRMRSLLGKDNGEGVIQANKSDTVGAGCYNCGSTSHMISRCTEKPNKCSNCGKSGHLEKYCWRKKGDQNFVQEEEDRSVLKKKPKGNKAKQRERMLQKVIAKLCELESDEEEEEEYSSEDEEDDDEYETSDVKAGMMSCCLADNETKEFVKAYSVSNKVSADKGERLFKVDSGCRGAHILMKDSIVLDKIDTSKWKKQPQVHGISGKAIGTTEAGHLGKLDGVALVAPKADSDLLSLMELIKSCDGTFNGDKSKMIVKNGEGEIMLEAKNYGDDFWSVLEKDIAVNVAETEIKEQFHTYGIQGDGLYLTAEQRGRAKEAYELCRKLRHPGDDTIIKALDAGLFLNCHLTSQDFRNGRQLMGPCLACQESKMVAPFERTSITPPATRIGEHVHADMILLEEKSIGGNSIIIVAKDEVSGYTMGIPSKCKSEKSLKDVGEWIIAEMNQYGHKVDKITTDDERCFHTWEKHLAQFGVRVTHTPAGLHEKRAERAIRTVGEHTEAIKAGLPYELPKPLVCEAYMDAITWLNRVPNKDTMENNQSPYQLVTGQKIFLPTYSFGQTGLFYSKKRDGQRAEWGIFVGYGNNEAYLRCYNPLTKQVTSKRKFVPQQAYPTAWNFKPRLRPSSQVLQRATLGVTTTQASQELGLIQGRVQQSNVSSQEGDTHTSTVNVNQHKQNETSGQEGDTFTVDASHNNESATSDQEGDKISEVNDKDTYQEDATLHQEGDVQTPKEATSEVNGTSQEQTDSRVNQITSDSTNENSTRKISDHDQASRPRRKNAGNWKDGPARFKAMALEALCSKATHLDEWLVANKTSLKQALKQKGRGESVRKSIDAEIDNLENPGVLKAVKFKDIPKEARKDIINAFMFHKEKFKADGSFDKDKCRIVLLSNQRDPDKIGDSHSPTVNPISVMTQINLACTKKHLISAYDIKGAFLLTPIEEGVELYLRIGAELTEFWCQRYPERIAYLHTDGCLYFRLERYVYGLHEAPNKFNGYLDSHLKKIGFNPSRADKCFYTKDTEEGKIMLSDHVDDMLVTFPCVKWRNWFEEHMKPFELVKQHDNVSYLGIQITRERNGDITLSQKGYIEAMLKKYGFMNLKKLPNRPATEKLTQTSDEKEESVSQKEYLALVMGLMYAARFTRADIAFTVGYLATKCSKPTEKDMANAKRVLKYLGKTIHEKMRFKAKKEFKPRIYADASHHLYDTGHGQAGMIITNGSAPVCYRSAKLKLITRSSSESELCSLEDASTYAVWYKSLLYDMGIDTGAIEILQDNKSTIIMATQGLNFRHNKHIMARKFFIQERIESGEVVLKYCKTGDMVADLLTKVVDQKIMNKLKREIYIS